MKVSTIIAIDEILKQKVFLAGANLEAYHNNMVDKYRVEFPYCMTSAESKVWAGLQQEYKEVNDLYKDFAEHQW